MGNGKCRLGGDSVVTRSRPVCILLATATVGAGLATRWFGHALPPFVADFAPDTLYAVMVFWLLGAIWTWATSAQIAFAALLFCYAIEASQLIQSPILSAVRATRLGGLVLGFGFLWSDIFCYMAGVAAGLAAEIGT